MRYLRPARSSVVLGALFLAQAAFAGPGAHAQQAPAAEPAPGLYTLSPLHSGKCLGVAAPQMGDGTATMQWSCIAGAKPQKWELFHIPGAPADVHSFKNVNSGLCLTVRDVPANGSPAVQAKCQPNATQGWLLRAVRDSFQLINAASSKALTVADSSTADGAKVIQLPAGPGNNQVWGLKRTV
ncbi:RICIN domain-containing protein [Streptomyces sp. NPDC054961]